MDISKQALDAIAQHCEKRTYKYEFTEIEGHKFEKPMSIEVKPFSPERADKVQRRSQYQVINKKTRAMEFKTDNLKFIEESVKNNLVSWSGLTGKILNVLFEGIEFPNDDTEIPYSQEMAIKLCFGSGDFSGFFMSCCNGKEAVETYFREAQEKNFLATSNKE